VFLGRLQPAPSIDLNDATYNIELIGAVPEGKQLNCLLPRRRGQFGTGIGYCGTWNHSYHDVRTAGLELRSSTLQGELAVTMNPDPYVPRDGKPAPAQYSLKATVADGCVRGRFEGTFRDRPVSGAVVGRLQPIPDPPNPAHYTIKLEDGLNEGAPWFRRVFLDFTAQHGKANEGRMTNNKGGWEGSFQDAAVQFDGESLQAVIRGAVDTSRSVLTGRYEFRLTGRAVGEDVVGTVETWRDGRKTKENTPFMGLVRPAPRAGT
jgi:hypothetical protein